MGARASSGANMVVASTPTPKLPARAKEGGLEQVCQRRGCGCCRGFGSTFRCLADHRSPRQFKGSGAQAWGSIWVSSTRSASASSMPT